ncbi:hypothetical protein [Streptomyces sp. NPDC088258]|uniref:hypothetical protein n=1 Tax=Streptomyces sp. NPDC088258 TaxID=3365849 RepID=UPI003813DA10
MTANPIERPSAIVLAGPFIAYKQGRHLAGMAAEDRHLLDPADHAFAALACEHPDTCSCGDDYPNWTPGGLG